MALRVYKLYLIGGIFSLNKLILNPLLHIETPLITFANRADPDQAALVRAALSGSTLFAHGNMIYLILVNGFQHTYSQG